MWNEKWESAFPTKEEKIALLKGLVQLEKFYYLKGIEETGLIGDNSFPRGSTAASILVFKQIVWKRMDSPELINWKIQNSTPATYMVLDRSKYNHVRDYDHLLEVLETERVNRIETEKEHALNRENKKKRKFKQVQDHKIRLEKTRLSNKLKYDIVTNYFANNKNTFLEDLITQNLPFPLNLTPAEELDNVLKTVMKMDYSRLDSLIQTIPRKSAEHIKNFRKQLIELKSALQKQQ